MFDHITMDMVEELANKGMAVCHNGKYYYGSNKYESEEELRFFHPETGKIHKSSDIFKVVQT